MPLTAVKYCTIGMLVNLLFSNVEGRVEHQPGYLHAAAANNFW